MQTEELPIHFPAKRLALSKIEGTHPSLLIIVLPALLLIAIASIAGTVILFNDLASDYQHGIILMLAVAAFSLGYFAHLLRQYQRNRAILHALNRADAQPWKLVALWADVAWVSDKYKKITFGYTATINGVPQQITFADRPNLIRYRNKFLAIVPHHSGAPALIDDTLSTIRGLTRAVRQDLIRQIQALLDAEMDEAA